MNRDRLEGKWKQFSGSVREQWGRLTDDRLSVVAGKHDQFAGRVQERYGIYKEEGERQLREFLRRNRDWDPSRRSGIICGTVGNLYDHQQPRDPFRAQRDISLRLDRQSARLRHQPQQPG